MPRKRLSPDQRRNPGGRPAHTDPPTLWEISLPTSLANKINTLLEDPFTGRPRYGSRSRLIETLLRRYLEELLLPPLPAHPMESPLPVVEKAVDTSPPACNNPPGIATNHPAEGTPTHEC